MVRSSPVGAVRLRVIGPHGPCVWHWDPIAKPILSNAVKLKEAMMRVRWRRYTMKETDLFKLRKIFGGDRRSIGWCERRWLGSDLLCKM